MRKILLFFILISIGISLCFPYSAFAAECADITDTTEVNFTVYIRYYDHVWSVGINPGSTLNNGSNNGWLIETPSGSGLYYTSELRYTGADGFAPSVRNTYEHAIDFTLWDWAAQVDTIHTRLHPDDPNIQAENIRIIVQVIDATTMLFAWEQNTAGTTWVPFRIHDTLTPTGYELAVNVVGISRCLPP